MDALRIGVWGVGTWGRSTPACGGVWRARVSKSSWSVSTISPRSVRARWRPRTSMPRIRQRSGAAGRGRRRDDRHPHGRASRGRRDGARRRMSRAGREAPGGNHRRSGRDARRGHAGGTLAPGRPRRALQSGDDRRARARARSQVRRSSPARGVPAALARHRRRVRPDDPRHRSGARGDGDRSRARSRRSGLRCSRDNEDIANARLEFPDGCVANLTASRVSAGALAAHPLLPGRLLPVGGPVRARGDHVRVDPRARARAGPGGAGLMAALAGIQRGKFAVPEGEPLELELTPSRASLRGEGNGRRHAAGRDARRCAWPRRCGRRCGAACCSGPRARAALPAGDGRGVRRSARGAHGGISPVAGSVPRARRRRSDACAPRASSAWFRPRSWRWWASPRSSRGFPNCSRRAPACSRSAIASVPMRWCWWTIRDSTCASGRRSRAARASSTTSHLRSGPGTPSAPRR